MKALRTLFVFLSSSLLLGQALSYSYSYSSTMVGDIRIHTLNNGSLYCDSLICPDGSVSCKVTKRNDPNNFQIIVRHRRCFDGHGAVLAEQTVEEDNIYNSNINMQVASGGGVSYSSTNGGGTYRQMTPDEQRELEEYLRQTEQRVQEQIAGTMNQVQTNLAGVMNQVQSNMAPFLDGSFAANLNRQIQTSFRNSFY